MVVISNALVSATIVGIRKYVQKTGRQGSLICSTLFIVYVQVVKMTKSENISKVSQAQVGRGRGVSPRPLGVMTFDLDL